MKPYLLKEYQNRWYIVGLIEGDKFRIFGIDRIENIELLSDIFKHNPKLNPAKLFENIIGLTYSNDESEEVILSFTPLQGRYIQALPLHRSQQIIKETKEEVLVKLTVIPNFELKQKILMMGGSVKTIKPEWLANEIKTDLANALKQYKK
jgi:predicted DNA-binding transcriptional regulator YafY